MLVLGIESTCDETGCSIVEDGERILSNIVSSQIDLQSEFGGVVPELACRRHIDVIIPVIDEALEKAGKKLEEIDLVAVANRPGLIGAILIGLNVAKSLAWSLKIPYVGVNHVEAHLYSALMSHREKVKFPCLGVVLSGGHSSIVLVKDIGTYEEIGHTVDDAIGESFDKVAKILSLPYPGGPHIEKLARSGDPHYFPLKAGQVKGFPYYFSFSGLKTGVLYTAKGKGGNIKDPVVISHDEIYHLAASFQHAAFSDVVGKTVKAAQAYGCESVLFGGGVCCNQELRKMFSETPLHCIWPDAELTLDNAAMIAGLGYHKFQQEGKGASLELEASTKMTF